MGTEEQYVTSPSGESLGSNIHMRRSKRIRKSPQRYDPVFGVARELNVQPSPGYPVLYQIPEGDTRKTTIYDQEISYGQTVKPSQTTHNVAH